jgi:hypothetical protein
MRANDMIRIARASSAGFAMPITAQFEDEGLGYDMEDTPGSSPQPDKDWARRMLEDLRNDEDVFQQGQDVGPENVAPTDEQRTKIDDLKEMFPGPMDFSEPDGDISDMGGDFEDDGDPFGVGKMRERIDRGHGMTADYPETEDDPRVQRFMEEGKRIDDQKGRMHEKEMLRQRTREDMGDDADMFRNLASNSSRLIRLAAHLDSFGLHDIADDLDTAAEVDASMKRSLPLSSCPKCDGRNCRCKGKPCHATVRMAQAQLAEVGLDEDDVDLEPQDDQSQIVSFDPDRGNMIVKDPQGVFKLYTITGTSETGKPRFELGEIIDSPDDQVSEYSDRLMKGDPRIEGYPSSPKLPEYMNQLMGGNPSIQQAYASRRTR